MKYSNRTDTGKPGEIRYYSDIRSISIIIPAYNEEARLPQTLARIDSFLRGRRLEFYEILVVDDGSRDRTAEVAGAFAAAHPEVRVLRNPGNRGKGYSVRQGMLEARGQWALFTDADLSAPIEELDKLVAAVEANQAQVAIGSREIDRSLIGVHQPAFRENAGRIFNFIMRKSIGLPFRDTQCGFKLFDGRAAQAIFSRLRLERFGFDVETLFLARLLGYKGVEVGVRWNHAEGSKVGLLQGIDGFLDLWRIRRNQWKGLYR
ncbi:MAG: dolichyl-phosphate beta-glucosyltransferase [Bryobacteraceae bacterium]